MSAPASYYDALLDDPTNAYGLPLEESPYAELYHAAARLIPPGKRIADLGCGSGRFASLVIEDAEWYTGIDFSAALLEEFDRYIESPGCDTELGDLRTCEIPPADVYVLLELMEHLDDDIALLRRLPGGASIVASVPSFDSASHLRTFPDEDSVRLRYENVIGIRSIERIDLANGRGCFWLIGGTL